MRLRDLKIAGFRGFNSERVFLFSDRVTVIGAPNSYGKTSISEALEFLLYGSTSKVDMGDYSKEEYRGCYRNVHFPKDSPAFIEATLSQPGDGETVLRIELDADATTRRFLDGLPVAQWPFHGASTSAARPFVLQHALKHLLLVSPADRFQGFARLVGLTEVESCVNALLALCTKPTATVPKEARDLLERLDKLRERLSPHATLKKALSASMKGISGVNDFFAAVEERGDTLLGGQSTPDERLHRLIEARDLATSKIYAGDVTIRLLSPADKTTLASTQKTLTESVTGKFLDDCGRLAACAAADRLREHATLLEVGQTLLAENPAECPLCMQPMTEGLRQHLAQRHAAVTAELERVAPFSEIRMRAERVVRTAQQELGRHRQLLEGQLSDLLAATEASNEAKVRAVFGDGHEGSLSIVRETASAVRAPLQTLQETATRAAATLATCETALSSGTPALSQAEEAGQALEAYLASAAQYMARLEEAESALAGPAQIFRQSLDAAAGTAELSLVINVLERRDQIGRALRLEDVISRLKSLKTHVQHALGETMEKVMNTELTASVMGWYAKIKTTGDPDVHFSGFALPRTKAGDFKARTIAVKASSYGVDLASAVSSLSESKLNALGLCVSIASALRAPGPWGFLIIDDPIQSWDDEHETQFVEVLRSLVASEGKQLVVLSHKTSWAKQVCQGCRSLNGIHYELTGYRKDGPVVLEREWCPFDHRIREAESIAADAGATSDRLQQGEEEIRLAACHLASLIARENLNRTTSAHKMNSADVRAILNEAGASAGVVDRIAQAFVSADEAHHVPKNYQPSRERILRACSALRDAKKLLKEDS